MAGSRLTCEAIKAQDMFDKAVISSRYSCSKCEFGLDPADLKEASDHVVSTGHDGNLYFVPTKPVDYIVVDFTISKEGEPSPPCLK
jgi:hypothetical protein